MLISILVIANVHSGVFFLHHAIHIQEAHSLAHFHWIATDVAHIVMKMIKQGTIC